MTASNNEIYRAIGQLTAEVTSLRRDIQEDAQTAVDAAKRADDHRSAIHRRVDDLVDEVGAIKSDMKMLNGEVKVVNEKLADVKDVTDDVVRWKQAGIGALGITGIAAGSIAALVTAYWQDILRVFTGK